MNRLLATMTSLAAAAMLLPPAAPAATTIGQLPTPGSSLLGCDPDSVFVQDRSNSDASYEIPFTGVLTRWRYQGGQFGSRLALGIYARGTLPNSFTPHMETPQVNVVPNQLNTLEARATVHQGDVLAMHVITAAPSCRFTTAAGNQIAFASPAPPVGNAEQTYTTAQDGQRLNAQAVIERDRDSDGFGDHSQDGCPADAARHDDCVGPVLAFGKAPKTTTSSGRARFRVSSDEPLASLECALDGRGFRACRSSKTLTRLDPGRHRFRARGTDANGNEGRAIQFRWRVR